MKRADLKDISAIVAGNIRALRHARGWSVRQFAEECAKRGARELTAASLSNLDRASDSKRRHPTISVDRLVFFAELFDVPVERLLRVPKCSRCSDAPPPGFACLECGTESPGDQVGV